MRPVAQSNSDGGLVEEGACRLTYEEAFREKNRTH